MRERAFVFPGRHRRNGPPDGSGGVGAIVLRVRGRDREIAGDQRGDMLYLWLKAFHVVAIIAWMAGMLYLPRLFVYHCEADVGSRQSETFKVMERRLLRFIIDPAMIATWILGLWLAWWGGWFAAPWWQLKLVLVIALSAVHGILVRHVKDFAADRPRRTPRFYRILNEIPTVLMIAIVILAVVKPF
jgi:putative membrane protein